MRSKGSLARRSIILALSLCAAAVAAPARSADWLTYGSGPLRHNSTPEEFVYPLTLVWRFTTEAAPQRVPPVVVGDRVFWAAGSRLWCLDRATGAALWNYDAGDTILGAPTYADGLVVFGADNGKLVSVSAADGKEAWTVACARAVRASPAVVDGVVYTASLDRRALALDLATGAQRWAVTLTDEVWGAPAVMGDTVYLPTADAQVFGLDTSDGRTRLQVTMPRRRALLHPIVAAQDMLYIAGRTDLTALHRRGGQRWYMEFETFLTGAPALAQERLYLSLIDGRVIAVDAARGRVAWEFDFGTEMSSPPTVAGDLVVAGAVGGMVYALDAATGEPRWRYLARPPGLAAGYRSDFDLVAPPVYANGSLYLAWDDGSLARFDPNAPDTTGPTIRLLTPAENRVTGTNLPKLIGAQVFDEESGLDEASLAMTVDGITVEAEYDPYTGYFTYSIEAGGPLAPLKSGWHSVSVTARDQRGNQASRAWRFVAQVGAEKQEQLQSGAPASPGASAQPQYGPNPPEPGFEGEPYLPQGAEPEQYEYAPPLPSEEAPESFEPQQPEGYEPQEGEPSQSYPEEPEPPQ